MVSLIVLHYLWEKIRVIITLAPLDFHLILWLTVTIFVLEGFNADSFVLVTGSPG